MSTQHITFSERIKIEEYLNRRLKLSEIAKEIGRDKSTVSREIRRHIIEFKPGAKEKKTYDCLHRLTCSEEGHCTKDGVSCFKIRCTYCSKGCGPKVCDKYEREYCPNLLKSPYVCNGCSKIKQCFLRKSYYEARSSDKEYRTDLSELRSGFEISQEERLVIDEIMKKELKNGHSVYAALVSHPNEIKYSIKTLYNYINGGVFESVGNKDLPRKPQFKQRKEKKLTKEEYRLRHASREGRKYEDYINFTVLHPEIKFGAQMDSVVSPKGEKRCLLTLMFTSCNLQLSFLRENNSSASVTSVFRDLRLKLGLEDFMKLFPVILTDNGTEFYKPEAIEHDEKTFVKVSHVFYCHPMASWEKGKCENNHTFIRRILPKKRTFSDLTQKKVELMMNHINSYPRKSLDGKSPTDLFIEQFGEKLAKKLGIKKIPTEKVLLKPTLF